jgi:hypothetical protein
MNASDRAVPYTIERVISMCDGEELEMDESAEDYEGEAGANLIELARHPSI